MTPNGTPESQRRGLEGLIDRIGFQAFKRWPMISLIGVASGNPFEDHPALRTIWAPALGLHAETDTVADLALGRDRDPHHNNIYLIQNESGQVVGVTGFYQPMNDPEVLGLRWHGIIPEYRGRGYSHASIEAVCLIAATQNQNAKSIIEYVSMDDAEEAAKLAKHFQNLAFFFDGDAQDVAELPSGASLPAGSGDWAAFRRSPVHTSRLKLAATS